MLIAVDYFGIISAMAYLNLMLLSWDQKPFPVTHFLGWMTLLWVCALAAAFLWRRSFTSSPVTRILFWGLVFRLIGLGGQPILEDDHFRFLWDGRMLITTGNPYINAPIDFFDDETVPVRFQEILDQINHPDIPTIYGPVCQFVFGLGYIISPGNLLPLKIILTSMECLAILLLMRMGVSGSLLLLYSWCPLLIKETAFTCHPDAIGMSMLFLSIYFYQQKRDGWAMTVMALAVGTKPFALLFVPLLAAKIHYKHWGYFAVTLLIIYLPFIFDGGLSGLNAFLHDWEYNSFGYGILVFITQSPRNAKLMVLILFGLFYVWYFLFDWIQKANRPIPRGDWLFGVFFLLAPVINPWYLLWMLPFLAIYPSLWGWTAAFVVTLSYINGLYVPSLELPPYHHPIWLRPLEFGLITAALPVDLYVYLLKVRQIKSKRYFISM